MSRTARLAQVEDAIHAGTYYPSASQVASQLLDEAEVDARLQATLKG
jgi:anti-sigma28 factor (negative regulator of flagellin synthesis)